MHAVFKAMKDKKILKFSGKILIWTHKINIQIAIKYQLYFLKIKNLQNLL